MTITDGRIKKKIRKALKYVNKNKQGNDYMKKNIPTQATNQTTLYMNTEKNIINNIENYEISHYCSTEKGSSGSPIINLLNHKVIGIHKKCSHKFKKE